MTVTVQTGCAKSTSPAESIHLREKNIAGPTERSRKGGVPPLRKLGGQDLRFSMKMMLTPDQEESRSPSELLRAASPFFIPLLSQIDVNRLKKYNNMSGGNNNGEK